MDAFFQDVRYALRTLAKSPGFALIVIICLALGIGVNTAIYSVVDTALVQPFPFADPEQLVILTTTQPRNQVERLSVSYPTFRDWQADTKSFTELAAIGFGSQTLQDGTEPERLEGASISWNLFPMLGVAPVLVGRETDTAWLVNTGAAQRLFGRPEVTLETMIGWTADWVSRRMPSLGKDTHFDVRDGNY